LFVFSDCAHTKREVAPTNVSVCVCANECARVLIYLSFITLRSPLARGRQPETTTVVVFSNNKGRFGHSYGNKRRHIADLLIELQATVNVGMFF